MTKEEIRAQYNVASQKMANLIALEFVPTLREGMLKALGELIDLFNQACDFTDIDKNNSTTSTDFDMTMTVTHTKQVFDTERAIRACIAHINELERRVDNLEDEAAKDFAAIIKGKNI